MGDAINQEWASDSRVKILHVLDDIGMPYSCTDWGNGGLNGVPIIDDGSGYYIFEMFKHPGSGAVPLVVLINYKMEVLYLNDKHISQFTASSLITAELASMDNAIPGCTDIYSAGACNINTSATYNDGSCIFPPENYDCSGNCTSMDCAGVCGGGAVNDCVGVCNGNSIYDDCNICTGISGYVSGSCHDCAGLANGTASLDNCGICVGGNTGKVACTADCLGVWGGPATEDACGVCNGNGNCECENQSESKDCMGICGGTSNIDDCNVCTGIPDYIAGKCHDCAGVANGTASSDNCGTCDIDASNDCTQDCKGEWGGNAEIDCNGECGGQQFDCLKKSSSFQPVKFGLIDLYPNPFNSILNINFDLSRGSITYLTILDVYGYQITSLHASYLPPGQHHFDWNAHSFPSGVYLVNLKSGFETTVKKVVLLK